MTKLCTNCGQPLPQPMGRRICATCSMPIKRHHRYHIGTDGKLHHNDCSQPVPEPAATMRLEIGEAQ